MEPNNNLYEHCSNVTPEQREALLKQCGCVVWFTGLSGSGKSTVAHALEEALIEKGHLAFVLDGDNVRRRLNANLGFSDEDRKENIRRISEVARLFAECGVICITAFISPFRADRAYAREIVGTDSFIEIFLSTSIEDCEKRDPKGLYMKARAGEIADFTGISSPYEAPEAPELEINSSEVSVEDAVKRVIDEFHRRGHLLSGA